MAVCNDQSQVLVTQDGYYQSLYAEGDIHEEPVHLWVCLECLTDGPFIDDGSLQCTSSLISDVVPYHQYQVSVFTAIVY